ASQPRQRHYTQTRLAGGRGVILGRIFRNSSADARADVPAELDERATIELCREGGRGLVNLYWGNYVAFLCEPGKPGTRVLRDCSGGIPCFWTRAGSVTVFFADARHLRALDISMTLNRRYLAAFIYFS